ncbi:peptidylprolyl isomerase SurA [Sodalis endosymbiont of Henestaris halophilus]|uniref:peptidylprolyl isomerase SurA n=1 Tax=Sodalis endosymbiont of Henestaris halophilus TaxID=1929246 RepID=UPI000BC0B787|nr:peptidylprolyl isomerase SurA [Sodalis endosymbiont of Henestaris halophilus]SNC58548.1 Chaperone SurA precursor [Sodalis endosymbiont of Henestaris halophilus]
MKNWKRFCVVLVLCAHSAIASTQVVDKVVAVVNNNVVLESDVNSMLTTVKLGVHKSNKQLPDDTMLSRQILDQLIMDNIILQLAQRANIVISDEQLDQAIDNIAIKNHMTIDHLRLRLAREGMDYDTFRAKIGKDMLISKVRDSEVFRRVTILPQEVDSLAKKIAVQIGNDVKFNLNHILIPLPENPTQEQLDKATVLANSLVERSKNGTDFCKLAINSSGVLQELKVDQMGWRKFEEIPSIFVSQLRGVQKDSIIGPIRSGVGLHILKVNDICGDDQREVVTEVHARHILLCPSVVMTDQQAQAKLEDIAAQINSGLISFDAVAKQLSEDYNSANQGGDLGWNRLDAFDLSFQDTLMHLHKGELSSPVHSAFGWHLIELIDTRQIDSTDFVQKDRAYQLLLNRKFAEEEQFWMQEQLAAAYVKIFQDNEQ